MAGPPPRISAGGDGGRPGGQGGWRRGPGRWWGLRRLAADRRGSVLIELVIGFAVLVPFILAAYEVGRFILLVQKVERVALSLADLHGRQEVPDIADLMNAVPHLLSPFPAGSGSRVLVTQIVADTNGDPIVANRWQGGGTYTGDSRLGPIGTVSTLPPNIVLLPNEQVIVAEAYYLYVPFLLGTVAGREIYQVATLRRRSDNPVVGTPTP